ncbi:uncharacterized protein LOC129987621 [Argiope bruennichi]|uniref:uncharacterized protein LOC129987621 n=1 Tax=Argiope bruennichi TaxID=94029 RepID=UPI002494FA12|nr:uncharacterized protein LOC129987621 [Argiope bruennichi]
MRFLILFAVGALFGCVQCDKECFRAVFKECIKEPIPSERLTLCDETKNIVECISRFADKCKMDFRVDAEYFNTAVQRVCKGGSLRKLFDEEKACYKAAVSDSECDGPIKKALNNAKTTEEIVKANKKVCKLFKPFSVCVGKKVTKNCGIASRILFDSLYNPYQSLSNSLCEQLVLPANEKEDRPDNFGLISSYSSLTEMFS